MSGSRSDDAAYVGVPADALPEGTIVNPPAEDSYLSAESPSGVVARAAVLAEKVEVDAARVRTESRITAASVSRKLITLYLVLCAALVVFGWPITRAVDLGHSNCVAQRISAQKFNSALDILLTNAMTSNQLTPAQKAQRVSQYVPLHEYTPRDCPGIWPWEH